MRIQIVSALFMTLASAFMLYGLNYDTRQLQGHVSGQEQLVERLRNDIAVLKAERAHLARPERIEPLARAQGLKPAGEKQFVRDLGTTGIITGSNPAR